MSEALKIIRMVCNRHDTNAYAVLQEGRPSALVIDPGWYEAETPEMESMPGVDHILLTHEHIDHIAAVDRLRARYRCTAACSAVCSELMVQPKKNMSRYILGYDVFCEPAELTFENGHHELAWGSQRVQFFSTPGHSPGSACIAIGEALFTGDTIIPGLKTVTKLPGGSREDLERSMDFILSRFGGQVTAYPGHGLPFQLDASQRNLFLGYSQS